MMKIQSRVTGLIHFMQKFEWEQMPVFQRRKYNILDAYDGELEDVVIAEEILDFSKTEHLKDTEGEYEPDLDKIKAYLKENGVKVHWNLSDEKIRKKYYEHKKGV